MNAGQSRFSMKVICTVTVCVALIAGMMVSPASAQTAMQSQRSDSGSPAGSTGNPNTSVTAADTSNAEVLKELQQMRARIADLEAQLKSQQAGTPALVNATVTNVQPATGSVSSSAATQPSITQVDVTKPAQQAETRPSEPFALLTGPGSMAPRATRTWYGTQNSSPRKYASMRITFTATTIPEMTASGGRPRLFAPTNSK